MRKFITGLAMVASLVLAPTFVSAQGSNLFGLQVQPLKAEPLSALIIAADTDVALYIKYVGSGDVLPKVAVETDGNLTFTIDGSAYDGFECPVDGAYGGVIDVSDAACDTLGEVVDAINSDDNRKFTAYVGAGLRSWSSNDSFLADAADNEVASPNGEVVFWDSSTLDDTTIFLSAFSQATAGRDFFGSRQSPSQLQKNPNAGNDTVLLYAQETITNAGTIGNFQAYCVVENYNRGASATAGAGSGSETVQTMYTEVGAATTAKGEISEFLNAGGLRCRDGKVVVTILASGADTSAVLVQAYGYRFQR